MSYKRLEDTFKDLIKITNQAGSGVYRTNKHLPNVFYVDRPHSVLGNPFSMTDESQRMEVLNKYADYFNDIVSHNIKGQPYPEEQLLPSTLEAMNSLNTPYWLNKRGGVKVTGQSFMDALRNIVRQTKNNQFDSIELADWCAPRPCHAETIGNYIGQYADKLFKNKR